MIFRNFDSNLEFCLSCSLVRLSLSLVRLSREPVIMIFSDFTDKAVEDAKSCWPKKFFHFFENFSKFFGIFKGENTLFSKSAQKWSSFRKKLLYIFPLLGGGSRPQSGIFHSFFEPYHKGFNFYFYTITWQQYLAFVWKFLCTPFMCYE